MADLRTSFRRKRSISWSLPYLCIVDEVSEAAGEKAGADVDDAAATTEANSLASGRV